MKIDTSTNATAVPVDPVDPDAPVNTDDLERRAKAARERLLTAVSALDKKRHHLAKPSKLVAAGVVPAALVTAAVIATGSIVAASISHARRTRPMFQLPSRKPQPSFIGQIAKHVALTVITFGISEAGKVAIKKLLPTQKEIDETAAKP